MTADVEYLLEQARRAQRLSAQAHRNAAFCMKWGPPQGEAVQMHARAAGGAKDTEKPS